MDRFYETCTINRAGLFFWVPIAWISPRFSTHRTPPGHRRNAPWVLNAEHTIRFGTQQPSSDQGQPTLWVPKGIFQLHITTHRNSATQLEHFPWVAIGRISPRFSTHHAPEAHRPRPPSGAKRGAYDTFWHPAAIKRPRATYVPGAKRHSSPVHYPPSS